MTSDPSESIFASSIRIKSAPVSAKQRTKPKINGVFEIPSSRSTSRTSNRGKPKPAWAQPSGPKKSDKTPVKSSRLARPKTPEHERTRIISKASSNGSRSTPSTSPTSVRMSVSRSFHIKQPALIDSIRLTEDTLELPTSENNSCITEFEKRDLAAGRIQLWYRQRKYTKGLMEGLKRFLEHERAEAEKRYARKEVKTPRKPTIRKVEPSLSRARMVRKEAPSTSRTRTRPKTVELNSKPKTARDYNEALDATLSDIKFSARIESKRPRSRASSKNSLSPTSSPKSIALATPRSPEVVSFAADVPKSTRSSKSPASSARSNVDDKLKALMSALTTLETPSKAPQTHIEVGQSITDLKLANMDQELRMLEKHTKLPNSAGDSAWKKKAEEAEKLGNLYMNETQFEKEQMENQLEVLHSAIRQIKEQSAASLQNQEKLFAEERARLQANSSQQHQRQLNFIDQLIKDKENLAEQVTKLVSKIEKDSSKSEKTINELKDKHQVELVAVKDKLVSAEKIRRDKWVEQKQKEIKDLTVKGLEPEIARLIARHQQELRNVEATHKAEILAADERAARRWSDQTERMRQAHEEEKVQISERERQRARENLERQLLTIEQENQAARDRLEYEKRSELERQEEHLEYLKESHKAQIRNLETLHADNMSSNMEEWKAKLMNMQKQKEVDIEIEQQKAEQRINQYRAELEKEFDEKSKQLESKLRAKVKAERDAEIERVVDRVEREMEENRENSERAAENKILRVQEKMQKEVDRAEKAESDALAKYAEARSNVNELSEQLMAERHRLNITATELEQKQDRVTKLLSERHRVEDVIREEFAERLVLMEKELKRLKHESSETSARHKLQLQEKDNLREEEINHLTERIQNAIKQRDEENQRLTKVADQAQRRANYMEEMLEKQNALLRQKTTKK